eukprot:2608034-Pleurochrysis_carterae.AAC.1
MSMLGAASKWLLVGASVYVPLGRIYNRLRLRRAQSFVHVQRALASKPECALVGASSLSSSCACSDMR